MWPLLMGGAIVVALIGVMMPLPVWTARVLRGRRPQLALPAAETEIGAELLDLHREVGVALDLVRAATASMADYAAASIWVRVMDRGSSDNWAKALVRRALYDEGEAYEALGRVLERAHELPERERDRLAAPLDKLAAEQRSIDGTVAADAVPGSHPRARDLRERQHRLSHLGADLDALQLAITAPPDDPYR